MIGARVRARLRALRELLQRDDISITTQAELVALLAARGHVVTQATVSRDLKRLRTMPRRAGKVRGGPWRMVVAQQAT